MPNEWLPPRLVYLRSLKNPTDHQQRLLALAQNTQRSPTEERTLTVLIRAEKAAERAQRAKIAVAKIVNAEKRAERKRRDRELYQAAGLLILAGLVDTRTGSPTRDRGELLGALISLASPAPEEQRATWKRQGDALLATSKPQATPPTHE